MSELTNQAWEDVADDVTGAIEKAVQPLLKKAVDDIYSGLLDATQDYLKDNVAFNIASRISSAEHEASDARNANRLLTETIDDLLGALGLYITACGNTGYSVDRGLAQLAFSKATTAIAKATGK